MWLCPEPLQGAEASQSQSEVTGEKEFPPSAGFHGRMGSRTKDCGRLLEAHKEKERDTLLEPSLGAELCWPFALSRVSPIPTHSGDDALLPFEAPEFGTLC